MIHARPYQLSCVDAGFNYYIQGNRGNQLWCLPTGTGKSLIPAFFMQRAMTQWPDQRMLLLTHVKELIQQNHKALKLVWPTAPSSIYSAGLGKKEGHAPIVLGGIGSVVNNISAIGKRDLLFIDEAHLLAPSDSSMYQRAIAELMQYNPALKVIGLTATPFRMGQGRLTDPVYKNGVPEPSLFTDISFDLTGVDAFNSLIDDYYLSPLVPKRTDSVIDVSDVRQLSNDFNQKQLNETVEAQGITGKALTEAYDLCTDRKSWIVFGAGIDNCVKITSILNSMGVAAVCVHSKMPDDDREKSIKAFKAGRFRAIVSNNILTTGFDHAAIDAIIDLRPTTSIPLHIQKYGRGTRPFYAPQYTFDHLRHKHYRKEAIEAGGKSNCLVLDFAGNTPRLGPINDPVIPSAKKGDGSGDVPIKICDVCGAYNHTVARQCIECENEFIFKTKIKSSASTNEIIVRSGANIEYLTVTRMIPKLHTSKSNQQSLRIGYVCGLEMINVFLSFDSTKGLPKHKAHEWWRQHVGESIPESSREALHRFSECRKTTTLRVDKSGNWPEVLEYLF